jgi:WXG100 family type VII secretion target
MADLIRVDYQELQKVADRFGQQSEAVDAMLQAVHGAMDPLEGGGWVGRGSDAFFNEMNGEILPAVQRLTDALAQAQAVTKQINDLMQQADEEASTGFKSAAGAGGGGRLGGAGAAGGIGSAIGSMAGAALGRAFSLDGLGGGGAAGGAWGGGGFNPAAGLGSTFDNILGGSSFGGLGGGFGGGAFGGGPGSGFLGGLGGGFGGGFGGGEYGIPRDWLSGVTDSLSGHIGSNYNDYGIPRDWLGGVTDAFGGSSSGSDYGIPRDWLDGVRDSFGSNGGGGDVGAGAGSGGAGGAETGGGSGGGSAGGGSPTGGGSGGGSSPQTDISDPFRGGAPRDFRSVGPAGGAGEGEAAAARLSYQSLGGMAGGGGSSAPAPAASSAGVSGGGGTPAPAAASQGNMGVPFGIAAASPFIALLGKAIKGKMDDD